MKAKIIITLLAALPLLSISCRKNCSEDPIPNCEPSGIEKPVCGCNGKTYTNASAAECAGIEKYDLGSCEDQ